MRTKEQLRDIIAQRIEAKLFKTATFSDLVAGISSATDAQKQLLVDLLVSGNKEKTGDLLVTALKIKIGQDSINQADIMLADDSLSLVELDSII